MAAKDPEPLECFRCYSLPWAEKDGGLPGIHGPYRPKPPRPVVYGKTIPSARCDTHRREDVKAAKGRNHDTRTARTYGVPAGWYAQQYERQGRKCAMPKCRATGKARRLAVDHDRKLAVTSSEAHPAAHAADRACRHCVRGLLCQPHNWDLMGRFAGDLEDAIAYRDHPPAQQWQWWPEEEEAS